MMYQIAKLATSGYATNIANMFLATTGSILAAKLQLAQHNQQLAQHTNHAQHNNKHHSLKNHPFSRVVFSFLKEV